MKVYVIGIGMGNPDTLTVGARRAIESCDLLVGARRVLEPFEGLGKEMRALIRSDEIVAAVRASMVERVAVLVSGDVGLYSGATILIRKLEGFDVEVMPGISSLGYLCARLRMPWQDVCVVSAHGRACDVVGAVQSHRRTFALTGGSTRVEDLCAELVGRGLGDLWAHAGEHLSYGDERIVSGPARELADMSFDGLSVLLVENERPIVASSVVPSVEDGAFVRGDVPMTKREVRDLAIARLCLRPNDTVWDVGAGTGSVSVASALAVREGQVIAIERAPEAVALIRENGRRFGLPNLVVIEGEAPGALAGLATPDRVFVGGSSGSLCDIMRSAIQANPDVRVVITAITLETVMDFLSCHEGLGLRNVDIVQLSAARVRAMGERHLLMGQNPVFLLSADGPGAHGTEAGRPTGGGRTADGGTQ